MPELAEVEFYRRRWAESLGEPVSGVSLHRANRVFRGTDPGDLAVGLPGRVLEDAAARGKQMLFRFGPDGWLGIHLGMAGKLLRSAPAAYSPHKHDHLVIATPRAVLVFRDTRYFGRVRWDPGPKPPAWWRESGPDLLSPGYTRARLGRVLERRARTPLKTLLLDQEHFPGIGNWMADEILWRAAIHPETKPDELDAAERAVLYRRIREVCRGAMRVIAPDWSTPPRSWLFQHRWMDGGRCPKTGAALERIQVGGRTTCFSPARQRRKEARVR